MYVSRQVSLFWLRRLDKPWAAALVFGIFGTLGGAFTGAKQEGISGFFLGAFVGGVIGTIVGVLFGLVLWVLSRLIGLDKPIRDPKKLGFPLSCSQCDFRIDETGPWTRRDCLAVPTTCPNCDSPLVVRPAICPRCGESAVEKIAPGELSLLGIRAKTCPFCGAKHDRWGQPL